MAGGYSWDIAAATLQEASAEGWYETFEKHLCERVEMLQKYQFMTEIVSTRSAANFTATGRLLLSSLRGLETYFAFSSNLEVNKYKLSFFGDITIVSLRLHETITQCTSTPPTLAHTLSPLIALRFTHVSKHT